MSTNGRVPGMWAGRRIDGGASVDRDAGGGAVGGGGRRGRRRAVTIEVRVHREDGESEAGVVQGNRKRMTRPVPVDLVVIPKQMFSGAGKHEVPLKTPFQL